MAVFLERKWPRLFLAAYLALSILGIFTFMAVDPLRSIDFGEDRPVSGSFFTSIDLPIGCLAEDTTITSKARGHSFSMVLPFGTPNTGIVLAQLSLRAVEKASRLTKNNVIPLKLRT
jgi:hypothetical protein